MRLRRSALYLPASNPRAIAKARTLPCDVVILDLEDAVAPEAKDAARAAAIAAIDEGGWGSRELVVRVNALDTDWGRADLIALNRARPDAVLVPKVGRGDEVAVYGELLDWRVTVWAMVETARAVLNLADLAAARNLSALVLGTNDLAKELRMKPGPDRAPLLPFLAQAVAAGRAHGVAILDGVCNALDEPARFAAECAQAVAYGCDGKTLIHPDQIAPCHAAFAPNETEVAWAEAVVAAFAAPDAAGKGALRVAGGMVERLHLSQAEAILARHTAAGETA